MSEKVGNIGFSLEKITSEHFTIAEDAYRTEKRTKMQIDFEYGANYQSHTVSVYLDVRFLQDTISFLILKTGCHFTLSESARAAFLSDDNDRLILPREFIRHLLMLSIGTARGVLHAKTEQTELNHILLPAIDVNEIIDGDVILSFVDKPGQDPEL
ncbi:MAG: hypothetical protein WBB45_18235 [Cyclobacteriaceae bacterium]